MIMAVERMVPSTASRIIAQVRRLRCHTSATDARTPSAADSVGVAQPA